VDRHLILRHPEVLSFKQWLYDNCLIAFAMVSMATEIFKSHSIPFQSKSTITQQKEVFLLFGFSAIILNGQITKSSAAVC